MVGDDICALYVIICPIIDNETISGLNDINEIIYIYPVLLLIITMQEFYKMYHSRETMMVVCDCC